MERERFLFLICLVGLAFRSLLLRMFWSELCQSLVASGFFFLFVPDTTVLCTMLFRSTARRTTTTAIATLLRAATVRSFSTDGRPIRWGILSAGKISSDYVKAIHVAEGSEVSVLGFFLFTWTCIRVRTFALVCVCVCAFLAWIFAVICVGMPPILSPSLERSIKHVQTRSLTLLSHLSTHTHTHVHSHSLWQPVRLPRLKSLRRVTTFLIRLVRTTSCWPIRMSTWSTWAVWPTNTTFWPPRP